MPAKAPASGAGAGAVAATNTGAAAAGKSDFHPVLTRVFDAQDYDVLPDLAELMAVARCRASKRISRTGVAYLTFPRFWWISDGWALTVCAWSWPIPIRTAPHSRPWSSVAIHNIKFEKKVDPTPILKLIEYALWCEPNKLEHMPADARAEVIEDFRRFEFTLNRELGQCLVDEKLMIESLKAARQHAAAQQLAAQTAAQTTAQTAALTAAVAAGTSKDPKSADATAIAAAATAAAAAAVAAAPTAAGGSTAAAAAAAAAAVAAAAPRAGAGAAANIRGSECFQRIEKKRSALTHVLKTSLRDVGRIVCCKACDRVVEVYTKPQDPMNGMVLAEMKLQIADLEGKIKEAHGIDNKQKRKRLQRKLKELESRANFLG